mmetsp:Transcript_59172/g.173086  ORF Transcript_59172/g.173086 Transcript_59172/m.173086 type:complete len:365 (+) Transcript_59172:39-1133(+)
MDAVGLKLLTLVLTFFSGLGGVALAQVCAGTSWRRTLGSANSLAAGVLLAAGLVCMLPDASEGLPKGWASIWVGVAILALITVEEAAAAFATREESDAADPAAGPYVPLGSGEDAAVKAGVQVSEPGTFWRPRGHVVLSPVKYLRTKMLGSNVSHLQSSPPKAPEAQAGSSAPCSNCNLECGCFKAAPDAVQAAAVDDWSCEAKMMVKGQSVSAVKAVCLFVALSFHSVMEGLGVGTSKKMSVLASISTAILAHKALAAFALGNALRQSGQFSPMRLAVMATIFSAGTPCGIALGMYFLHSSDGVVVAACTAVAAGTFCQVAMMEIIPLALQSAPGEGFADKLIRPAMLALGFGAMSALVLQCG